MNILKLREVSRDLGKAANHGGEAGSVVGDLVVKAGREAGRELTAILSCAIIAAGQMMAGDFLTS